MKSEIQSILDNFLSNKNQHVFVLTGDWGTGKTHEVLNFMKEIRDRHPKDTADKINSMSYLSVFGTSNTDNFYSDILLNVENINHNNRNEHNNACEKLKKLSSEAFKYLLDIISSFKSLWRILKIIKSYKKSNLYLTTAKLIEERSIENMIIFIDDIERSDKNIYHDIFGIIDKLKNKKNCKIVAILNCKKINSDYMNLFIEFKEKTVDIFYRHSPDFETCINNGIDTKYLYLKNEIATIFTATDTKNIRTAKRISGFLEYFDEKINDKDYLKYISGKIALYTCLTHKTEEMETAKTATDKWLYRNKTHTSSKTTNSKTPDDILSEIFQKTGHIIEPIDILIKNYIDNGFINTKESKIIIKNEINNFKTNTSNIEIAKIKQDYQKKISLTKDEIKNRFLDTIKKHEKNISEDRIADSIEFMGKLHIDTEEFRDLLKSKIHKRATDYGEESTYEALKDSRYNLIQDHISKFKGHTQYTLNDIAKYKPYTNYTTDDIKHFTIDSIKSYLLESNNDDATIVVEKIISWRQKDETKDTTTNRGKDRVAALSLLALRKISNKDTFKTQHLTDVFKYDISSIDFFIDKISSNDEQKFDNITIKKTGEKYTIHAKENIELEASTAEEAFIELYIYNQEQRPGNYRDFFVCFKEDSQK